MTTTTTTLPLTRRTLLAAAAVGLAWRPGLAAAASAGGLSSAEALHLLDRAAGGPAPGDLERVMRMGRQAWIDEQLAPDNLALPAALAQRLASLETGKQSQHELVQRYRQLEQAGKQTAAKQPDMAASTTQIDPGAGARNPEQKERRDMVQLVHLEAGDARLLQALGSPRQLQEVMVDFWFNHFNVFDGKGLVRVLVESYEREAIRPNVFGKFRTLLGATAKHPAMLFYLDNWLSVGPNFKPRRAAANRQLSGLNENYAREVMELHTLGVDAGYTQKDVTELARILTGWTLASGRGRPGAGGRRGVLVDTQDGAAAGDGRSLFAFEAAKHDDGVKTWLGQTVQPGGQAEGEFALDFLARQPATARHVCTKLALHFVSDAPPAALVDKLARRFTETDGDIRAVLRTLLESAEFRDPKARGAKFKTPYQTVISSVRATGIATTNVRPLLAVMTQLGQPLFGCQTPDGYKDTEAAWLNPNAITQRVNFATALASGRLPLVRLDDDTDKPRSNGMGAMEREADRAQKDGGSVAGSTPPVDVATLLHTLGPAIGEKTRATIASSPPALQSALVLGSPDFMRH